VTCKVVALSEGAGKAVEAAAAAKEQSHGVNMFSVMFAASFIERPLSR
jgi:hypothetical protein